jgi:hypothetical protein
MVNQRPTSERAADIHFVLQAKGGIGKSFAAWLLAQWHAERGIPVKSYDTDPQNETLCSFAALKAEHVQILNDEQINVEGMDRLVESIITRPGSAVVDNGSSSFLPMGNYLLSNGVPDVLTEYQKRLVVHTIVVGGQLAGETLGGMVALLTQFPVNVPIVVWVNEHTKPFETNGLKFEETNAYKEHRDRIAGVIYLPHENPLTYGHDVAAVLDRHLTFAEAIASQDFMVMSKHRVGRVRDALFAQLDRVLPAI